MSLKNYLNMSDYHLNRYEKMYEMYKRLFEKPDNCSPMFIINVPIQNPPTWEERLENPLVMLKADLDNIANHMEIEDDYVPSVRVNFGTAQIAAAFGCEIVIPKNNLPAAGTHVLKDAQNVYKMSKPSLYAGMYPKLLRFTEVYLENIPQGVHIQLPDIQSSFNSAHLIIGNDIFTDFYDDPDAVEALLDIVTDYMIDLTSELRKPITNDEEWFFDWGARWKGKARISNCTMQMLSPDLYNQYVLPRDRRFIDAIGGGRVHYCGSNATVIDGFLNIKGNSGLDFDFGLHDIFELAKRVPKNFVLLGWGEQEKLINDLLEGNWPEKRNIIYNFYAPTVEEGKKLLSKLRNSMKL